jgi:hypothetical protein
MVASLVATDQINALLLQLIRTIKPAAQDSRSSTSRRARFGCIFKARNGGVA